jgi:DEAD/DEAH box helicase domain-containing protein
VSSSGLRDGVYGSMLMPEAVGPGTAQPGSPDEVDYLLQFVDLSLRDFVRAVTRAGRELPEAGFELAGKDGEIVATAELAWAGAKIAVLLEREWELRSNFEQSGWTVRDSAFAEELIEQLPEAKS